MPTFLELAPDAFASNFKGLVTDLQQGRSKASGPNNAQSQLFDQVRRPVRGLQIKDETFATLQVRTADGRNLPLVDAGGNLNSDKNPAGGMTFRYSNFLMQAVAEQRAEKTQIVETFGESYIFFYGEKPRMISVQGVLVNSEDFNWRAEWWENYDLYLRGSKCVETKSRVYLSWDDIVVEGYILEASAQESAANPLQVDFNFSMFLTNYANISRIGDPLFPKGGKEVNLSPLTPDLEGSGTLQSNTLLVRQLNQDAELTSSSLFAAISAGISFAVTASDEGGGGLGFGLSIAFGGSDLESLLMGRIVRVPIGFAGGSVFDDAQLALASVQQQGGTVLLQDQIGDLPFAIQGVFPPKFSPTHFGLISENLDEYVGRQARSPDSPTTPPDLFEDQLADDNDIAGAMKDIFLAFGIDTDPPSVAVVLAAHAAFGVISIGIGVAVL